MGDVRLTLRVDFGSDRAVGPGKIRLLETIGKTGSISQAGRLLGMSYRRAWLLVDELNQCFRDPVVVTRPGGKRGGGATLTPFGHDVIAKYRSIETRAAAVAKRALRELELSLSKRPRRKAKTRQISEAATK
jgi:molybdate transport system regulatory protein